MRSNPDGRERMARNQHSYAKRRREIEKKRKTEEKRARRRRKKGQANEPVEPEVAERPVAEQ